jgi:hypothetical protein
VSVLKYRWLCRNQFEKQIIKYDDNDLKSYQNQRGFNTSNFIYGLSTYIGYKKQFVLKYDLNRLFTDNVIDQNNVS